MSRKTYAKIGMVSCAIIAIMGLLILCGAMGGNTQDSYGSFGYTNGKASFGADFYTYVNNNAYRAASAAEVTADNLNEIGTLLRWSLGILVLGIGAIGACGFGIVYCGCDKTEQPNEEDKAAVAPEAAQESHKEAAQTDETAEQ